MEASAFAKWNLRLLQEFFSPAASGQEVFLNIDSVVLSELGLDLGGEDGFRDAIVAGPPWLSGTRGFVERVASLVQGRTHSRFRPPGYQDPGTLDPTYKPTTLEGSAPTYLPYLAALVKAAAEADSEGFYAQIRANLGLPDNFHSTQMRQLMPAWFDLQSWTAATSGSFGLFVARRLGAHALVGIPKSQSILSREDAARLPRIFVAANLRRSQTFGVQQVNEVSQIARDAPFLSRQFREALADPAYAEVIGDRLQAQFDDWDGTIPTGGRTPEPNEPREPLEVGLCLTLQDDNSFPWRIRWRVPALRDLGRVRLEWGSTQWDAYLGDSEGAITEAGNDGEACAALLAATQEEVQFNARLEQQDAAPISLESMVLRPKKLWVLTYNPNPLTGLAQFNENPLPLNGPAYILVPAFSLDNFTAYLSRENPDFTPIDDTSGLPTGWKVYCLLKCEALNEEQRNTLPDGEEGHSSPDIIRLVGGRSISRGGIRQYLPYDLPSVELDAQPGTRLEGAGLVLTHQETSTPRLPGMPPSTTQRFRITQQEPAAGAFVLKATLPTGEMAKRTLRVAGISGERVEGGDEFSLDPSGNPLRNRTGLRGILPAHRPDQSSAPPKTFPVSERDLGSVSGSPEQIASSVAAQFLDALARTGSMAYGEARDLINRLQEGHGGGEETNGLLFDLRSRGHLEIETTTRGHLARIHTVPPTLYELPGTLGSRRILGVLGTLRRSQWDALAACSGWDLYQTPQRNRLSACRLVERNDGAFSTSAMRLGFDLREQPSLQIARWSGNWAEAWKGLVQSSVESIGSLSEEVEKFSPRSGCFVPGMIGTPARGLDCELYRALDTDTRRHKVYRLAINGNEEAPTKFAFIRDSRLGIWLALAAFGRFLKSEYGIADASPWPFPYSESTRTLWLPARLTLPIALERALVLCHGGPPDAFELIGEADADATTLRAAASGVEVAKVSLVYADMARGRWLRYGWVSADVMAAIGSLMRPLRRQD